MEPVSSIHKLKQHLPAAFLALGVIFTGSVYVELLGWRIIEPEMRLSDAWSLEFFYGVIRTVAGAAIFGIILLLIGVIPARTRPRSLAWAVLIWSVGAGVFLIAMIALVLWAP